MAGWSHSAKGVEIQSSKENLLSSGEQHLNPPGRDENQSLLCERSAQVTGAGYGSMTATQGKLGRESEIKTEVRCTHSGAHKRCHFVVHSQFFQNIGGKKAQSVYFSSKRANIWVFFLLFYIFGRVTAV